MRVFIFLHILTMFTGVALGYGAMAWLWLSARSRDLVAMRGMLSGFQRYEKLIPITFTLGIILGLIAVFTNGYDPLRPWLIIAYVLAAGLVITGSRVITPWIKTVREAVEGTEGDRADGLPTPFRDQRSITLLSLDLGMLIAIIADMVLKPFS
jgi:Predicted integral membrane protein (DUF2269)